MVEKRVALIAVILQPTRGHCIYVHARSINWCTDLKHPHTRCDVTTAISTYRKYHTNRALVFLDHEPQLDIVSHHDTSKDRPASGPESGVGDEVDVEED
jgi:hypothetical protein